MMTEKRVAGVPKRPAGPQVVGCQRHATLCPVPWSGGNALGAGCLGPLCSAEVPVVGVIEARCPALPWGTG